ncbi:MAG: ThuA domain-containing protein [Armatimonadota bacterium]
MSRPLRVTVWNEHRHERNPSHKASTLYPNGLHAPIAEALRGAGMEARIATLDDPEHGLTDAVLESTDVLTWWGHAAHAEVADEVVEKVHARVLDGMGLVCLHSAHYSKIFRKLMGTTCSLKWREIGEKERIWIVDRTHPIADGLPEHFEIPHEEMYGETFDIPAPEQLVMISWFAGGEVFRSGCCYHRGRGRVFYFRPGHETYPTYYHEQVLQVIVNGVRWAAPGNGPAPVYHNRPPLEAIEPHTD